MLNRKTLVAMAIASAFALSACDFEQTREGEMPEVDVDVEGGQLPAYEVDAPDVDVEMEERTIKVPTIEISEDDDEPDVLGDDEIIDDPEVRANLEEMEAEADAMMSDAEAEMEEAEAEMEAEMEEAEAEIEDET